MGMTRDKVALTREEIIIKWDGMTPRERDAWVAKDVMGWHRVSRPGGGGGYIAWANADGKIMRMIESATSYSLCDRCDYFRPSSDISAAEEVLAQIPGEVYIYRKPSIGFVVSFGYSTEECPECGEKSFEVQAQGIAPTLPEAICLAAILAKLVRNEQ